MTIATQSSKVNYQGNGVTTEFQVPFPFLEGEDIYIQKQLDDTNIVNLTYGTDYSVTGAGNASGGTVVLTTAPSASEVISVYRIVPLTQEVDYRENEIFPAETHEEALDKLTMEVQQLQEQTDRAIRVSRFSDADPETVVTQVEIIYNSIDNVNIVADSISDVNTTALNIEAIQDAPNYANSANNSKIEAQNSANTAQTMATQASQSASEAAQSAQTATDKADEASESARQAVSALSLQIGDVFFAPLGIDESLNLRRYLNGQVLIQSQFVAFTNKVKSAVALFPSLATTEANWQAEKTNSKLGQCGKFVIDDTAGTIRLPAVVNAQGLVDLALIGGIKSESLPNITGEVDGVMRSQGHGVTASGVFSIKNDNQATLMGNNVTLPNMFDFDVDASRSSSAYQDNAPVQQEAVQYPYCIVVNVGVEEPERPINDYQVNNVYSYGMSQYYKGTMNNNSWLKSSGQWNSGTVYTGMYNWLLEQMNAGVSGFVASTDTYTDYDFVINTTDQTFRLPLIAERVIVAKKEPTDGDYTWYNLYSDGWLEQGGYIYQAGGVEGVGVVNTTTLPKAFKNNDYAITMSAGVGNSGWQYANGVGLGAGGTGYNDRETHMTPTTFTWFNAAGVLGAPIFWEAKGYAEVPTQSDYTEINGLYYYIGDTLQNAQLVNVARIEETLVDKADADLSNCTKPYVTETYRNGTSWYRIWSDGFIEQSGMVTSNSGTITYNFITPFKDTNYSLLCSQNSGGVGTESNGMVISKVSNTQFSVIFTEGSTGITYTWYAFGY